ncbi:MAG: ergothioneine biosynthesis protein EgtB [Melioribacteraceae bacterium]|nr:MAG: ergothioneine biosynthesis protein EgtB [Melioribacteraceae bacterium]
MHKVYLQDFELASRLITNGEFIEFIENGGYSKPELWLSNGFAAVETENWNAPLYWEKIDNVWHNFTLSGLRQVVLEEPVTHISFYEAEAFAHWRGFRLPTEFEWEIASLNLPLKGNFVENENFHPVPISKKTSGELHQMFGDVWEWTRSDYAPYPGYKVPPGAIGEYNGKFMSGQIVLRGGSCATSSSHIRNTYRNFFPANTRWQFSGIRLAKDKER